MTDQFSLLEERLRTINKVMTTKAAIAQTPKELVWTLNKAKLYRYIPVVPAQPGLDQKGKQNAGIHMSLVQRRCVTCCRGVRG
jgi:hypothetical protein